MKKAGFVILTAGTLITFVTGCCRTTIEEYVEIDDLEILTDIKQRINWPPLAGMAAIAIGAIMIAGRE